MSSRRSVRDGIRTGSSLGEKPGAQSQNRIANAYQIDSRKRHSQISEKESHRKTLDVREDGTKDDQAYKQPGKSKIAATNPIEITPRLFLIHEKQDSRAAVKGRRREKIKNSEKKIERVEDVKRVGRKAARSVIWVPIDQMHGASHAKSEDPDQHEKKVGGGACERHPARAPGMPAFPVGIVRSAGKADHTAGEQEKTDQGKNHHAVGRAANVRNGIETHLTAKGSRIIATEFGNKGVRGFMASGRKKKNHIRDETESEHLGREVGHKQIRLGCQATESKEPTIGDES
jgi:hypothetical protein